MLYKGIFLHSITLDRFPTVSSYQSDKYVFVTFTVVLLQYYFIQIYTSYKFSVHNCTKCRQFEKSKSMTS